MNPETPNEEIELEWMPVYWEKLLAGTTHMDAAELGGYILLIAEQWKKGFVPDDIKRLMKIARQRSKEKMTVILEKFKPAGEGKLANRVCAEVRIEQVNKYLKASSNGKKGAKNRWQKDGDPMPVVTVSAITEERNKKLEIPKGIIHQQHTHEEFSKKFFTEAHEQDRVNIELQLEPKRLLHPLEVQQFNAHLHTANKIHETFHEWQKHLRNWLNTKPKLKAKTTNERTINTTDKIGRTTIEATRKFIDENSDENSEFEKRA